MSIETATHERPTDPETASARVPDLLTPVDGAPADGSATTFTWTEVPGAATYRLQVAADAGFEQLVCSTEVGPATVFTLLDMLPVDGSVFYWRVQAHAANQWQPWSRPGRFQARTDLHEIAYRTKQEAVASPQAAPAGPTAPAEQAAEATDDVAPYQREHTGAGTTVFFLALMILSFAVTFAIIVSIVNAAP